MQQEGQTNRMVDTTNFRNSVVAIGATLLLASAAITAACLDQSQQANPSTNSHVAAVNTSSDCDQPKLVPWPPQGTDVIRSCGGLDEPNSLQIGCAEQL